MKYHILRQTGTYADTLLAVGISDLFQEIMGGSSVRIVDRGDSYEIEVPRLESLDPWPVVGPGFRFIQDKKNKSPKGLPASLVLNYEVERAKAEALRKFRDGAKKIKKAAQSSGVEPPESPDPELRYAKILSSMRKGWSGDQAIFKAIQANSGLVSNLIRERFIESKPQPDRWLKLLGKITLSQLFNPASGKGSNRTKPDSVSLGNMASEDAFEEWMKIRGAASAMIPFRSGDDFRVYVLEPGDISTEELRKIRTELLQKEIYGTLHLDIRFTLEMLRELVRRSEVSKSGESGFMGRRPKELLRGAYQAFFQSLGSAAALMNFSFYPTPSWFPLSQRSDVEAYYRIIDEHWDVLRALKEDNSSDVGLLNQYRKWLLSSDLRDWFKFLCDFPPLVMYKLARRDFVRQFSEEQLTALFVRGYGMEEIVNDPGFKSLAKSIRNATVNALWLRQQGQKGPEVRFGMAQEMKQKIRAGDAAFLAALAEFVNSYMWEVEHRLDGKFHKPSTEDLDSLVRLVAKYHAELVGMLLLAYGYARSPKAEATVVA